MTSYISNLVDTIFNKSSIILQENKNVIGEELYIQGELILKDTPRDEIKTKLNEVYKNLVNEVQVGLTKFKLNTFFIYNIHLQIH
jgi:hypothetical protein